MYIGSVLEGEAMSFTKHKIKVTVSTKVACVTSLVQLTECPFPLLISVNDQVHMCDQQASVCL